MELRKTKHNASCRGCDRNIAPNTEDIIYMYSMRNRGQNIFLCAECIKDAHDMMFKGEGNAIKAEEQ